MAYYNPCAMSREDMMTLAQSKRLTYASDNRYTGNITANYPNTILENPDFVVDYIAVPSTPSSSWTYSYDTYHIDTKYEYDKNYRHACFVKIPIPIYMAGIDSGNTTDYYLFLLNKFDGQHYFVETCSITALQNNARNVIQVYNDSYQQTLSNAYNLATARENITTSKAFNDWWNRFSSLVPVSNVIGLKSKIETVFNSVGSDFWIGSFNDALHTITITGTLNKPKNMLYRYTKLGVPVFDWDNPDAIINFLNTGDESGAIDPFDPNNPEIIEVTDYKSNFTLFLSNNDDGKTNKFSWFAYNPQFNENAQVLQNQYGEYVYGVDRVSQTKVLKGYANRQSPVVTHDDLFPIYSQGVSEIKEYYCYFSVFPCEWDDLTYKNHSGVFKLSLDYKASSELRSNIKSVQFSTDLNNWTTLARTPVTDGYSFTSSTGETLTILFRSIAYEDLNDLNDDGYPNKSDTNDNTTGETSTFTVGSGLLTYKLSSGGFSELNKALWTTDWTTVFKSTQIDPIKCVITCKGIPFDVSGVSTDTLYLANRSVDVGQAVTVTPIKEFNVGSYSIQANYGNFVDITYTKVHLYLPYIGWVELPASEVINRVGNLALGYTSKTHTLSFKYLVDFVDGTCRAIISVDGTERWYFDGNCAIDIPVTSDNHTTAVSNAIKSGVSTVMSVTSAVGGVASGNPLMVGAGVTGAIASAPNTIPTYEFSATASSSGYINNSMNKNIMIVLEYPNAFYCNGYGHKVGYPCERNLTLGTLTGFTKCCNVDVSGINATPDELTMIKSALESGVYL